jgi:hypothetical protein
MQETFDLFAIFQRQFLNKLRGILNRLSPTLAGILKRKAWKYQKKILNLQLVITVNDCLSVTF